MATVTFQSGTHAKTILTTALVGLIVSARTNKNVVLARNSLVKAVVTIISTSAAVISLVMVENAISPTVDTVSVPMARSRTFVCRVLFVSMDTAAGGNNYKFRPLNMRTLFSFDLNRYIAMGC